MHPLDQIITPIADYVRSGPQRKLSVTKKRLKTFESTAEDPNIAAYDFNFPTNTLPQKTSPKKPMIDEEINSMLDGLPMENKGIGIDEEINQMLKDLPITKDMTPKARLGRRGEELKRQLFPTVDESIATGKKILGAIHPETLPGDVVNAMGFTAFAPAVAAVDVMAGKTPKEMSESWGDRKKKLEESTFGRVGNLFNLGIEGLAGEEFKPEVEKFERGGHQILTNPAGYAMEEKLRALEKLGVVKPGMVDAMKQAGRFDAPEPEFDKGYIGSSAESLYNMSTSPTNLSLMLGGGLLHGAKGLRGKAGRVKPSPVAPEAGTQMHPAVAEYIQKVIDDTGKPPVLDEVKIAEIIRESEGIPPPPVAEMGETLQDKLSKAAMEDTSGQMPGRAYVNTNEPVLALPPPEGEIIGRKAGQFKPMSPEEQAAFNEIMQGEQQYAASQPVRGYPQEMFDPQKQMTAVPEQAGMRERGGTLEEFPVTPEEAMGFRAPVGRGMVEPGSVQFGSGFDILKTLMDLLKPEERPPGRLPVWMDKYQRSLPENLKAGAGESVSPRSMLEGTEIPPADISQLYPALLQQIAQRGRFQEPVPGGVAPSAPKLAKEYPQMEGQSAARVSPEDIAAVQNMIEPSKFNSGFDLMKMFTDMFPKKSKGVKDVMKGQGFEKLMAMPTNKLMQMRNIFEDIGKRAQETGDTYGIDTANIGSKILDGVLRLKEDDIKIQTSGARMSGLPQLKKMYSGFDLGEQWKGYLGRKAEGATQWLKDKPREWVSKLGRLPGSFEGVWDSLRKGVNEARITSPFIYTITKRMTKENLSPDSMLGSPELAALRSPAHQYLINEALTEPQVFNDIQAGKTMYVPDMTRGTIEAVTPDPAFQNMAKRVNDEWQVAQREFNEVTDVLSQLDSPLYINMIRESMIDKNLYDTIQSGKEFTYTDQNLGQDYLIKGGAKDILRRVVERGKRDYEQQIIQNPSTNLLKEIAFETYDPSMYWLTEMSKTFAEGPKAELGVLKSELEQYISQFPNDTRTASQLKIIDQLIDSAPGDKFNAAYNQLIKSNIGLSSKGLKSKLPETVKRLEKLGGHIDPLLEKSIRIGEMKKLTTIMKWANEVAGTATQPGGKQYIIKKVPGAPMPRDYVDINIDNKNNVASRVENILRSKGDYIHRDLMHEINQVFKTNKEVNGWAEKFVNAIMTEVVPRHKSMLTVWNPKVLINNEVFNRFMLWVAYGEVPGLPANAPIRSAVKSMMRNPESHLGSLLGKRGGLGQAGLESELTRTGYETMNVGQATKTDIMEGIGRDDPRAIKQIRAGKKLPGQIYQGSEIGAKSFVWLKEMQKAGYDISPDGKTITAPGGRVIQSLRDFTKNDITASKAATDMADWYLINYAKQSGLIKAIRQVPGGIPFATFYADIMPKLAQIAAGRGRGMLTSAQKWGQAARFWSVPAAAILVNELAKAYSGITDEEEMAARDAGTPGTRSSGQTMRKTSKYIKEKGLRFTGIPDALNLLARGKEVWMNPVIGRDKQGNVQTFPLAGLFPLAAGEQTTGVLSMPSIMSGMQDPITSGLSLSQTGVDPFTGKQVVNRYDPDRASVLADLLLQKMYPFPYQAVKRIGAATQGLTYGASNEPQSVLGAAVHSTTPLRPFSTDIKLTDSYKMSGLKDTQKGVKEKYRRDLYKLDEAYKRYKQKGDTKNAERVKKIMDRKEAELEYQMTRWMDEYLKANYPRQYEGGKSEKYAKMREKVQKDMAKTQGQQ
ncbi:hypothetical protein [Candidatus Magnetobacterium casense]|uniref:Large polyvalent protein associated domain-containing protein n=1 Tax=Candidatus Magnetobacterium casense TaxID=1455061 RepID=A0ABS6RWV4_9BACT|nr:hypothetical protein [Candidatus Magnetobacterium casensis]MBV6341066.1 hypothetical protein [Candidatus Magnetobacterium casensis]